MKERLISYAPDMVRAKRAGLKTQTRRILDPELWSALDFLCAEDGTKPALRWGQSKDDDGKLSRPQWLAYCEEYPEEGVVPIGTGYGNVGDILLTREAWRTLAILDDFPPRDLRESAPIWYEADGPAPDWYDGRYRHARFMCRWMCRDRDEITAIRIERLQDIDHDDARAEGCIGDDEDSPAGHYERLWEQINGAGSWDLNPWVWVVSFRRIES